MNENSGFNEILRELGENFLTELPDYNLTYRTENRLEILQTLLLMKIIAELQNNKKVL